MPKALFVLTIASKAEMATDMPGCFCCTVEKRGLGPFTLLLHKGKPYVWTLRLLQGVA